jgi:hypothetical protein
MKRVIAVVAVTIIVVAAISVNGIAHAKNRVKNFKVTITNITRGQIISPPVVFTHKGNFRLFQLGAPAIEELAYLAEDAMTDPLSGFLKNQASVFDVRMGAGVIMPGDSLTVYIDTKSGFRFITAVAMLVTTNDAFMGVQGVYARSWKTTVANAAAYDAGSEYNSEDCTYIPGPPCGNGGVRDTGDAEGYVYVHSGIHGGASLDPPDFDWQNPVARIVIESVK